MTTPERCELCGDKYHEGADTKADMFGLLCPGAAGSQEAQQAYVDSLAQRFSEWVREQAFAAANEAEKLAEDIFARKQEWYSRNRTEVTQDELQADCDRRVPEVRAELVRAEAENTAALDVDPPHTTVPVEPENDPSKRPAFIRTAHRSLSKPDDALLYVDPPQGPEPYTGPPWPDDFTPTPSWNH